MTTLLLLVACVLSFIELIHTRFQGILPWACFLGFLGLTLSTWRGLL